VSVVGVQFCGTPFVRVGAGYAWDREKKYANPDGGVTGGVVICNAGRTPKSISIVDVSGLVDVVVVPDPADAIEIVEVSGRGLITAPMDGLPTRLPGTGAPVLAGAPGNFCGLGGMATVI
jgi:hypothetical protein